MRNESVSECGYLYGTKTRNHSKTVQKTSETRKTQQPTENQMNLNTEI